MNTGTGRKAAFPHSVPGFVRHFFHPYRYYFTVMLLINFFVSLYISVQPYVLKTLLDAATPLLGSDKLIRGALWPAVLLVSLTILNNLAWRLNNYVTLKSLPALKADIIDETSDYTHGHSFRFFQDHLSGSVSNRIVDLANNTDLLILNCRSLFQDFLTILTAIVISSVVSPYFSLVFLIWTLFFIRAAFYFSKSITPFSRAFAESRSQAVGNVVDSFANAVNVILFSRRIHEKNYLRVSLDEMASKDVLLQSRLMRYAFIMSTLTVSVQAVIIALLLYLGKEGFLTIGDFALIFMLTLSVLDHVWHFTESLFKVAEQFGVFNQALQFLSIRHEIIDQDNAAPLNISQGKIEFSHVKFFYNENQRLFEDKTLVINGREKVGLVGYSGSGKSSFVNLITRIFDVEQGDIFIDGQSIYSVTLNSLRENIAFIPQDPALFHRSLMDNIRYGNLGATDDEVIEAAKKAHVHEFAAEFPLRYQTLVGERGVKLSGGQRQRIAIACAILKNAPILIMDEATSSLDSVTESLIQESLKYAMTSKTVIIIAHRLSTIKAMDRILVFDKGKVMEEGTHEALLKRGVIYNQLWKRQHGFLSSSL
ncbi:Putative multidrug export ATP-binding/permease protein [Aquicella siphonis]|uniref:Multidrug export ATP-binding/permease protein n=1 Tax=Aquicella siphonis TaxID=254247 RepID=A0A5E4PGC9_9COXI|nr:ABC transporter ATP-binding protein [Aquicella siphonis]VVC75522.1 Putative multidrug export ATP-binding/permease protein [Aquicella siphonis]